MLLNFAIESVVLFSAVYFAAAFVCFTVDRIKARKPMTTPVVTPVVTETAKPVMERTPVKVEVQIDTSAAQVSGVVSMLNSYQLRRLCTANGIKWCNARSDGRHLRKAEMLALLT